MGRRGKSMSEPIQETSEKKSSRQKGMEAWAAAMAARQAPPGPPPGPEQDGSGTAYARPGASQRPHKIKTVTHIQKSHESRKSDSVDLARNKEKVQPELTLKAARELVGSGGAKTESGVTAQAPTSPPPPSPVNQAPQAKVEKAIQEAVQDQVAEQAQTVTAEEVQAAPSVASTVAAKSMKSAAKTEKAESTQATTESEEAEEDSELAELVKPGNSLRASAYVRAGDLLPDGAQDSDLDDYMLAL